MPRRPRPSPALAAAVSAAAAAMVAVRPAAGGVVVEQIEAFVDQPTDQAYAPVAFPPDPSDPTGKSYLPVTVGGITYHPDPLVSYNASATTYSDHAAAVGSLFYGPSSVAYGRVTDVYAAAADDFLTQTVGTRTAVGAGNAPGDFAGGALVINNSYAGSFAPTYPNADLDAQRRVDVMVARNDVTFVSAAANTGGSSVSPLVWSSYNGLAVSNRYAFSPAGSPGKAHADLSFAFEPSYGAGIVSGYAAGLIATGQSAGQADANRGTVVRSLLMAGSDPVGGSNPTANNLDAVNGAGQPDYDASLAILQSGERTLAGVSTSAIPGSTMTVSTAAATPGTTQQGWTSGTVANGSSSAVLFSSANAVTGVRASLNWDVTSGPDVAGHFNTANGTLVFPNLTLRVAPAFANGDGTYTLGPAIGNAGLSSTATGDNVQFLFSSAVLGTGTYAFLIGGDAGLSTRVGFSYELSGTFASAYAADVSGSWGTPANWTNGIPNGAAAAATFPAGTAAATVTLDGDRRVGQLNLTGGAYTIAPGTGGTLILDDSGDSAGTVAAGINVSAGAQAITAPVLFLANTTATVATGASLNLGGGSTGAGGLAKAGSGGLVLGGAHNYTGPTAVNAGTLVVTGSTNGSSGVTVAAGGVLAGTGSVGGTVTLNGGATLTAGTGATAADSVGTLTTGAQTWLAGSAFAVKVNGTTGAADELVLSGLSNASTGLTVNPILVAGTSLSAGSHTSVIADDTAGTTAFDALLNSGAIAVGTAPPGERATLSTAVDGTGEDLLLTLTAVAAPEPTGLALLAAGVVPLALRRRRRSRG